MPIGEQAKAGHRVSVTLWLETSRYHSGWQHINCNIFSMRTQKTGTTITVEFLDSQMVIISASPTGEEAFIANENGRPFSTESHIDKSAHGIRKLSATSAAEGGAHHPRANCSIWMEQYCANRNIYQRIRQKEPWYQIV